MHSALNQIQHQIEIQRQMEIGDDDGDGQRKVDIDMSTNPAALSFGDLRSPLRRSPPPLPELGPIAQFSPFAECRQDIIACWSFINTRRGQQLPQHPAESEWLWDWVAECRASGWHNQINNLWVHFTVSGFTLANTWSSSLGDQKLFGHLALKGNRQLISIRWKVISSLFVCLFA